MLKDIIFKIKEFKIPTLLGLAVIFIGIIGGVFLVLRQNQSLLTFASPDQVPQNITISNITDQIASISWQTTSPETGYIKFGPTSPDQTVLDDRDTTTPVKRQTHHVTLKGLTPQTPYQFKIVSGKTTTENATFTTAPVSSNTNNLNPVIASILNESTPVEDGIIYFSVPGGVVQSAPVKNLGNFIIPLNNLRSEDLSNIISLPETTLGKLTAITSNGPSSAVLNLSLSQAGPLPPMRVSQNLDLSAQQPASNTVATEAGTIQRDPLDLNSDGLVNTNDYAIVLRNFGKDPKEKAADLNSDGVVDEKDLLIISEKINRL